MTPETHYLTNFPKIHPEDKEREIEGVYNIFHHAVEYCLHVRVDHEHVLEGIALLVTQLSLQQEQSNTAMEDFVNLLWKTYINKYNSLRKQRK